MRVPVELAEFLESSFAKALEQPLVRCDKCGKQAYRDCKSRHFPHVRSCPRNPKRRSTGAIARAARARMKR